MIRQLGYISFTIKSINLHFDVNHSRDTFHIHNKNGNKTVLTVVLILSMIAELLL